VVLGPADNPQAGCAAGAAAPWSAENLADHARQVGEALVAELEWAARLTGHWSDEELGLALVDTALSRCLSRLAETQCWGRDNQLPSSELWRVAGSWLETGSLQHRARFKPRGYAGDFQLLNQLWEGTCSDHPLGRLFDRFFQSQAAVLAVRARVEQAASVIAADCLARDRANYHVVSIGSGSGVDIERAVQLLPPSHRARLKLTLLDLDEEALEHARGRLSRLVNPQQIVCRRENLFRLASLARCASLVDSADFSLCIGLFDYLALEPASALLRLMWQGLASGGQLLVGNFSPHCPTRAYMEWLGNWYLLYRTPAELLEVARQADLPSDAYRLGAERTGIDLFLHAVKPAPGG
jgi:extracellular factor (EF) 3-hydroxypalmitic acid methyl ester biosynthesis protein